jgi:hypothetical protein
VWDVQWQGLKPNFFCPFTARLKSCPDTKHESSDYHQTRPFRKLDLSASPTGSAKRVHTKHESSDLPPNLPVQGIWIYPPRRQVSPREADSDAKFWFCHLREDRVLTQTLLPSRERLISRIGEFREQVYNRHSTLRYLTPDAIRSDVTDGGGGKEKAGLPPLPQASESLWIYILPLLSDRQHTDCSDPEDRCRVP